MLKRRIRDPVHDLIEFDNSELERTLWRVLETRPFQRLRRIKQLGFSDLIIPVQVIRASLTASAFLIQLGN